MLTLSKDLLKIREPEQMCAFLCEFPAAAVERNIDRAIELSYTLWRKNGAPVVVAGS
jgi:hypothetical protein